MNYYNLSERLKIYKYDKNNVTIKFNLQLESISDNISTVLIKLMFILIILICKINYNKSTINGMQFLQLKDRGNPNKYVEPYSYLKTIDVMEIPYIKFQDTILGKVAESSIPNDNPYVLGFRSYNVITNLMRGNGGGINSSRLQDLLDMSLEMTEW